MYREAMKICEACEDKESVKILKQNLQLEYLGPIMEKAAVEAKIAFEVAHEAKEKAALKAKEDFVRKAKEFKDIEGETKKERSRSKSVEKSSNNNWILGVGLLAAAAFVTIKVLSRNRDQ